ncbi:MAG: hypothetical protein AMJ79_08585 [Phycisphaerae bacterium SM23_30]|nr:MAG: hypothetical protein AMJ79_08585 [Phycisphaerae bacterium SM23_30]
MDERQIKLAAGVVVIICLCGRWGEDFCLGREIFTRQCEQRIPAFGDGRAWMEPVTLNVYEHGIITDIDVYLDITHSEVSDLWIFLDAPQGDNIILKDDELAQSLWKGIHRPNMYGTIFDDSAELKLGEGVPPYTGRFKPAQEYSLSQFNSWDVYGEWTLRIYDIDGALADTGFLHRWELQVDLAPIPEPVSIFYLALPAFFIWRRKKGRYR